MLAVVYLFSKNYHYYFIISPEDIEKCKEKDMLEQLMTEMAGTFPSLSRVFVEERDIFLAHSLKRSTCIDLGPTGKNRSQVEFRCFLPKI